MYSTVLFHSFLIAREKTNKTAAEEKKGEQEFKQKKEYFKNWWSRKENNYLDREKKRWTEEERRHSNFKIIGKRKQLQIKENRTENDKINVLHHTVYV